MDGKDLFNDFKNGNLKLLFRELYPALISYATKCLGGKYAYLAEDCVQDSIFRTYLIRDRLNGESALKSYIYTSIRNRAISILRKDASQSNYLKHMDLSEQDITASIIEQETLRRLFVAIDRLPESYRQIFELSFEEGLKNSEVARKIGQSESSVKKRKSKMVELLRRSMKDDGDITK